MTDGGVASPAPWTAPGSVAPGAGTAVPPLDEGPLLAAPAWTPAARARRQRSADTATAVPVPLRPMSVIDIVDGGIAAVKSAPGTMLAAAAVVVVPAQLLLALASRSATSAGDADLSFGTDGLSVATADTDIGFVVLAGLGMSLALSLVCAIVARLVAGWYVGATPGTAEALRRGVARWPAVAAAWFLVHLAEAGAAVVLVLPAVAVMAALLVTTPVVAIEGVGPVAGLRRSWRLTSRRFWPVLGAGLLIALVDGILTAALTGIALLAGGFDWSWIVDGVLSGAAALVTTPFVAAATTLVYLDLRVRHEGLDIELRAADHLPHAR